MDFKQVEQTRRLVEVTALLALSLHGEQTVKVKKALQAYAFPEEIDLEWFVKTVKKIFQYAIQFTQANKGAAFPVW